MDTLEKARMELKRIIAERCLALGEWITVRILTPDETIGSADETFVIKKGKERVIEARFRDTTGQAFTDAPGNWDGTLGELLEMELGKTTRRALFTAGLNAVLSHLDLASGVIHCKDDEPSTCGVEMSELLRQRFGAFRYGLIGLQPAILKGLTENFGVNSVKVLDLNPDNIGSSKEGVIIMDGEKDLPELVEWCDIGLATGSSVVNGTINEILVRFRDVGKPVVFFGNTISGVATLLDLERICPFGR